MVDVRSARRRPGGRWLAVATGLAALMSAAVHGDDSIEVRIAALEAEVAALKAERADRSDDARREARRHLVMAALEDSVARASWRRAPGGASFDGRPRVISADGDFEIGLAAQLQLRAVANRLGSPAPGVDRTTTGFEARRVRLKAVGHLVDERLRFQLGGGFDTDGGEFGLTDAFGEWREDGWAIRVGRFRPAFLREEATSAKRLPMVERSLASRLIRQQRFVGLQIARTLDDWRVHAGIADAFDVEAGDGLRANARVERRIAGSWRGLRDETGFPGEDAAAAIGGGVVVVGGDDASGLVQATADLVVTGDGWGTTLVAAFEEPDAGDSAWAVTARAGWFVAERAELTGRVVVGDAGDELLALVGGVTWHPAGPGHRLTVRLEIGHAIDGPGAGWRTSNTGWREESGHGQWMMRAQTQLQF